jgi:hypothetical protein
MKQFLVGCIVIFCTVGAMFMALYVAYDTGRENGRTEGELKARLTPRTNDGIPDEMMRFHTVAKKTNVEPKVVEQPVAPTNTVPVTNPNTNMAGLKTNAVVAPTNIVATVPEPKKIAPAPDDGRGGVPVSGDISITAGSDSIIGVGSYIYVNGHAVKP